MTKRFDQVDDRFELVKQEFGLVRGDLDRVDERLGHVDEHLDRFETSFTVIDANFVRLETKLVAKIDGCFEELRKDIADIKVELVGKIGGQERHLQDHEVRIKKLELPSN